MATLSPREVEDFETRGYCYLRRAFTAEAAQAARAVVWRRMAEKRGIREDDPSTWPAGYDIEEHLSHPTVLATFTDRLASAIEDLVGYGRWIGVRRWGLWPVNFRHGADESSRYPAYGWHVDGNWFTHTVDCPLQGLLVIGFFSDVDHNYGGTVVSAGSHKRTARILAAHPEGLTHLDLFEKALAMPLSGFEELTGAAGDVALAHPFLFHTRGFKRCGPPRVLSNTEAPLREPMLLRGETSERPPVERAIMTALREPQEKDGADAMSCRF